MSKLSDLRKAFRKSVGSSSADASDIVKITGYLSTGSYAINRIISGNIYNGFPEGRITCIAGESSSGKSLLVANAIADALNNKGYDFVAFFDSEAGALWPFIESKGVDLSKIEHIPVNDIEDCSVKMIHLYDNLVKAAAEYHKDPENNEMPKVLVVLDSFGGLAARKTLTDATQKDQMVQDVGQAQKLKGTMIRILMMRVAQSNCALLLINHVYQNPGAMYQSKIQEMGGGLGLKYSAHVILQMTKMLVKSGDDEYLTGKESDKDASGFYKGNRIKAFCVKNRMVKPNYECSFYMDYSSGESKWDGLIPEAERWGFLQPVRGGYVVPSYSDKKVTYRQLVSSDEIWNTFIDKFNEKSMEEMSYSNSVSRELDKIEEENGIVEEGNNRI